MNGARELPYVEPASQSPSRVIVALTMLNGGLVRTRRFRAPIYVGDPINAVKIFADKGADEIVLLEIGDRPFDIRRESSIGDIASEASMPISYGGGIRTIEQVRAVIRRGFEKVVLNSALHEDVTIATRAASEFGSQAIVGSIEIGSGMLRGRHVRTNCGRRATRRTPTDWARCCEAAGCGELLVTSVERDGMMGGYDLETIAAMASAVSIPVIPLGGAGTLDHLRAGLAAGASAVAAGSMFVFHGPRRAVLINYPDSIAVACSTQRAH